MISVSNCYGRDERSTRYATVQPGRALCMACNQPQAIYVCQAFFLCTPCIVYHTKLFLLSLASVMKHSITKLCHLDRSTGVASRRSGPPKGSRQPPLKSLRHARNYVVSFQCILDAISNILWDGNRNKKTSTIKREKEKHRV